MYYKVIQDGMILDAWENPQFVQYKERFDMFLLHDTAEGADGVILPSGSDIWLLEESDVRLPGKEVARLVEITKEEYDELIDQLEETGGGIKEPEPEQPEEPEPGPELPEEPEEPPGPEITMTRAEMTKLIQQLQAQNAMLEECLLEMSEIVYA